MTDASAAAHPADSELLAEYRAFLRADGKRDITSGIILISFGLLVLIATGRGNPLFTLMLPTLGAVYLVQGLLARRRVALASEADALGFVQTVAFSQRVQAARLHHTYILIGGLVVIFLAQHAAGLGRSIALAGLVKDRVWEGEWWRLLSCALLHANLVHILTNGASLLALGRLVETQGDADDLPIVFTVATFTGSLASCLLMPSVPSVGASGGILGLSGYLLVLAFKRRGQLPPGLSRMLWKGVALTALVGVLGYQYIDNAAHAGGLLGGALVGLLLVRREPAQPAHLSSTVKAMVAWGCLGWFGGAAFFCVRSLLKI